MEGRRGREREGWGEEWRVGRWVGSMGSRGGGGACKRLISEAKHRERVQNPSRVEIGEERLDGRWRINEWVLARLPRDTVGGASGGGGNTRFIFQSLIPGGFDRLFSSSTTRGLSY